MHPPSQPSTELPASHEADAKTLREFLASGSVLCPSCGYDVSGCEERQCPECAWPLSLQLRPRASFVPYWVFSLLIHGWLFLWGFGGSFSIWLRAWQFHSMASRNYQAALSQSQSQALIQQFTGRSDAAIAAGASGQAPVPMGPAPATIVENFWTFFIGQNLLNQTATTLYFFGAVVGGIGLLMTPWMKRSSPRVNGWLMSAGMLVFVLMMANYVATYVSYLSRAF